MEGGGFMLDLRVDTEDWGGEELWLERFEAFAAATAERLGVSGRGLSGMADILLTGDAQMHALNLRWRARDKPTDVLSFPAEPEDAPFLGDIAIGFGVASRDAAALGRPLHGHVGHLLVHGLLHLLGHDHEDEAEAMIMEGLEREILASMGLPDPYSLDSWGDPAPAEKARNDALRHEE